MPTPAYFADVSRDLNNVQFGSPHRTDIARYYMAPRSALGLPPNHTLRTVDGKYVIVDASTTNDTAPIAARYYSAARLQRDQSAELRRVRYARDGSVLRTPAPLLAYMPLAKAGTSTRSTAMTLASADSDDEAAGETLSEMVFRRAKEYNEHLRAHPHDVDAWLAFAAFQEQFVSAHGRPAPGAVDDKRIAVLQVSEPLANECALDRVRLTGGVAREC
jgi:hypothetical protein